MHQMHGKRCQCYTEFYSQQNSLTRIRQGVVKKRICYGRSPALVSVLIVVEVIEIAFFIWIISVHMK